MQDPVTNKTTTITGFMSFQDLAKLGDAGRDNMAGKGSITFKPEGGVFDKVVVDGYITDPFSYGALFATLNRGDAPAVKKGITVGGYVTRDDNQTDPTGIGGMVEVRGLASLKGFDISAQGGIYSKGSDTSAGVSGYIDLLGKKDNAHAIGYVAYSGLNDNTKIGMRASMEFKPGFSLQANVQYQDTVPGRQASDNLNFYDVGAIADPGSNDLEYGVAFTVDKRSGESYQTYLQDRVFLDNAPINDHVKQGLTSERTREYLQDTSGFLFRGFYNNNQGAGGQLAFNKGKVGLNLGAAHQWDGFNDRTGSSTAIHASGSFSVASAVTLSAGVNHDTASGRIMPFGGVSLNL